MNCDNCKHNRACTRVWRNSKKECPHYVKTTNADRIRYMTDEELALVLKILAKNDVCLNPNNDGCDDCADCVFHQFCKSVRCEEDVEYWLKQPYKEEV